MIRLDVALDINNRRSALQRSYNTGQMSLPIHCSLLLTRPLTARTTTVCLSSLVSSQRRRRAPSYYRNFVAMMAPPPRVPTSSSRPDKDTTNTTDSSTASASSSSTISRDYGFTVSQVPENPLGGSRYIKTAAALIIGYVWLNYIRPLNTRCRNRGGYVLRRVLLC